MTPPEPNVPPDNRILFYKRDAENFGFLSNFYPTAVEIEGQKWLTVEHYYQSQKSSDSEYRDAIRQAATPGKAKRLGAAPGSSQHGSNQSWFHRNGKLHREDWDEVKVEVMRSALVAKFRQHPDLAERLLETGDAEIVEESATDFYWGAGHDGQGLNWLGRLLMELRSHLKSRDR
jgi:ribA/ribD-fused uncharacterized protein